MNTGTINTIQNLYMNAGLGPQRVWENIKQLDVAQLQGTQGRRTNIYNEGTGSINYYFSDDGVESFGDKYIYFPQPISTYAEFSFTTAHGGIGTGYRNKANIGISSATGRDNQNVVGLHFLNTDYEGAQSRALRIGYGTTLSEFLFLDSTHDYKIIITPNWIRLYDKVTGGLVKEISLTFPTLNTLRYFIFNDEGNDQGANQRGGLVNGILYK